MTRTVIVCSNIIEQNGKFLLVKETKKEAKDKYNFPAGTLEGNEDIFKCAIREAEEEAGVKVKLDRLVGIYQRPEVFDKNNITTIVFKSTIVNRSPKVSKEHPEVNFYSYEEILDLKKKNLIRSRYILPALEDHINKKSKDISCIKILR